MLDQLIQWFHVNAQFITAVIAILTPILPTVIVKAINDKKLVETLKNIRNTEDLKKMSSDLLNEKVIKLQSQLERLIKQQNVGEKLSQGLLDTQKLLENLSKKTNDEVNKMMQTVGETLNNLNKLIPELKNEFYMIVGEKDDK